MVAETVLIDVKNEGELGRAHVNADFTMRNMGSESETMAVRFPISAPDGRSGFPELKNLVIRVDGRQASYRRVNYPDIQYQQSDIPWAEFDATFPPGQDVAIKVAYSLEGSGYFPYTSFYYVLQTGAGWKDTIGSADIILRLPYAASSQNVVKGHNGWEETTHGGVFHGNEVRWHFENFEPEPGYPVEDMRFALVSPQKWTLLLKEKDNVTKNPNDGEAWGRLGKAYKDIFLLNKGYREDSAGEELYRSSIEAYEKCLSIKPDDAQWHAGFADLLASRSYWDSWQGTGPDSIRALEEIHTALRLAPNDPVVLEIAQFVQGSLQEGMITSAAGYDFPWLTQTPSPPTPIVPLFDPAVIPGMYQSVPVVIYDRNAQLTLNLRPDFTADMETKFEDGQTEVASGSWEMGDITIHVSLVDPYEEQIEFTFLVKENSSGLQAGDYPSAYSADNEEAMEFNKVGATPQTQTDTPIPTPGEPAPASQPPSSLCGSTALAPIAALIWMKRKRT
jgi:tetratricopeptide (TPR) repeat protein